MYESRFNVFYYCIISFHSTVDIERSNLSNRIRNISIQSKIITMEERRRKKTIILTKPNFRSVCGCWRSCSLECLCLVANRKILLIYSGPFKKVSAIKIACVEKRMGHLKIGISVENH